jgi:hypothetical protein
MHRICIKNIYARRKIEKYLKKCEKIFKKPLDKVKTKRYNRSIF